MPSRKKVKSAKKPKKDSISINIKNVVKQVQNERQRTDFLFPQRDPRRNLNMGSMTRLVNPEITYASTPLSAFPTLQSLVSAPPQSQLKSRSDIPVTAPPLTAPKDIQNDNALVPVMKQTRITPSAPIIPEYSAMSSYGNPVVTALPIPIESQFVTPRALPNIRAAESQMAVAAAMDQDVRNMREGLHPALYAKAYDSEDEPLSRVQTGIREQNNREYLTQLISERDVLRSEGFEASEAYKGLGRQIDSVRKRAGNAPPKPARAIGF